MTIFMVEALNTGDLDEDTKGEVIKIIQIVLDECGPQSFAHVLRTQLVNRYGPGDHVGVADVGKTIFLQIKGIMGKRAKFVDNCWRIVEEGLEVEDLSRFEKQHLPVYNGTILFRVKTQGVPKLARLSAYKVASCIQDRNNVELLQIPDVVKDLVYKFIDMNTCIKLKKTISLRKRSFETYQNLKN